MFVWLPNATDGAKKVIYACEGKSTFAVPL
jgi:hypothetical protein